MGIRKEGSKVGMGMGMGMGCWLEGDMGFSVKLKHLSGTEASD